MLTKQQKMDNMIEKYDWEDCFCGGTDECIKNPNPNRTFHSHSCKLNHQNNKRIYAQTITRQKRRHERRANHQCIHCGVSVKPKLVYPQACPKHYEKYILKPQKRKKEVSIVVQELND